MARKSLIIQLALATLIGMPMVAMIIDRFSETVDLRSAFIGNGNLLEQIGYGVITGVVIAVIARLIISSPLLRKINVRYANIFGRFNLTTSEVIFISVCAGVGEEILFRGAIQPFLGILVTAVFFVAIHGYLNPSNWRLSIYGGFMTIGMCAIGYFSQTSGLLAAILAHTIIDILLIFHLQKTAGKVFISENPDIKDMEDPFENQD